ncbi:hypothetical protein Syun_001531 [Stephania yunnanensis]|uniref:DUF632 domain-containing protein n=1 Tax=Stephania yunnanensis TaxID=152371 RepID=A0AAP0QB01_9MAGN
MRPAGEAFVMNASAKVPHSGAVTPRKNGKSAKVFSAFSWSRSSKSLNSNKNAAYFHESTEISKPGAHGITLDKLYAEEERLYKEVKGITGTGSTTGKPLHYKGSIFHRIIKGFMAQPVTLVYVVGYKVDGHDCFSCDLVFEVTEFNVQATQQGIDCPYPCENTCHNLVSK